MDDLTLTWYQYRNFTKQDLLKIEGQYIKNNNSTLNCLVAGRTQEEYKKENRDKRNQQSREYKKINKEKINEKKREKVECEFCKSLINKCCLRRHQKTQKCLKSQTNISCKP